MNGFIVLYRGECDDLVLWATEDRAEAKRIAKEVAQFYRTWDKKVHHPLVEAACEAYKIDLGTYCCVTVLTIKDGTPKRITKS